MHCDLCEDNLRIMIMSTKWSFQYSKTLHLKLSLCQSFKIYIAPLQDPYSEALLTQAKWKRTVLRKLCNWEQALFGRCLRSIWSPFQVVGPTTEKERVCIDEQCSLYSTTCWSTVSTLPHVLKIICELWYSVDFIYIWPILSFSSSAPYVLL